MDETRYRLSRQALADLNEIADYLKDLEEMERFLSDREENRLFPHFARLSEPSTRLELVIEGVN